MEVAGKGIEKRCVQTSVKESRMEKVADALRALTQHNPVFNEAKRPQTKHSDQFEQYSPVNVKRFPIFRSDAHGKFLNLGKMFNLFPHYQPLFPAFKSYSNDAI